LRLNNMTDKEISFINGSSQQTAVNLCLFHLFFCKVHTPRVDKLHNERSSGSQHPHVNVFSTGCGKAPLACQNELIDRLTDVFLDRGFRLSLAINQPRSLTKLSAELVVTANVQYNSSPFGALTPFVREQIQQKNKNNEKMGSGHKLNLTKEYE